MAEDDSNDNDVLNATLASTKNQKAPLDEEVRSKIASGEWTLEKSKISGFKILVMDGMTTDFRTCQHCFKTYARTSTKSLPPHAAKHPENNALGQIEQINQLLQTQTTNFVLSDAQSFCVVEDEHFQKLIRSVIGIGRLCERNLIDEGDLMLPTEYRVANEIDTQYGLMRNYFLNNHKPVASRAGFACTFDFSQSGPDYGVLTIYYIDDSWKLKSFILNFVPFPMDSLKTGLNVAKFVSGLLVDNGFEPDECLNVAIVTDEASNMNRIAEHLHCACHILNKIAKHVTKPYSSSALAQNVMNDCKAVQDALMKLQKVIVKLRGLTAVRETLGTSLHVAGITRWVSKLDMVELFLKDEVKIKQVVQEKKPSLFAGVEKFYTDYRNILEDYCKAVGPIKKRIEKLEGEKYVTISHYFPLFLSLRLHWIKLNPSQKSSTVLKSLVSAAEEAIDKKMAKWNNKLIYSAAYLDPTMRIQIDALKDSVKVEMNQFEKYIRDLASPLDDNPIEEAPEETENEEDDLYMQIKRAKTTIDHELSVYSSIYRSEIEDNDPLLFWKNAEQALPSLAKIARKVLCIPANSAPSERAFSQFKIAVPTTRNRLSDQRIQQIMVLQSALNQQTTIE